MTAIRVACLWMLCACAPAGTAEPPASRAPGDALDRRIQAAAPQPVAATPAQPDLPPSAAGHSCDHAGGQTACGGDPDHTEEAAKLAVDQGLVRITDRDAMCMMSDRYLGERADVPVTVEGKTYHGCCANCATRLSQVAELRRAVDPVSGRAIDKGSAVIARDPQNKLLYFESEDTLAAFSAR